MLLAVSGGLDSMVMMHLFFEAGIKVSVAHCNFALRGEESDADEKFVISRMKEHHIHCHVKKVKMGGGSVQVQAREIRYRWFEKLCEQHGYNKIAVAHHLDDTLETTLLNLARGTGIKGMGGIPEKNGKIIRPLLFASKNDLIQYANDIRLDWREDSSNRNTDYDRNKIRLEVIPKLKELNPSLLDTYFNTRERLRATAQLTDQKVREIKEKYLDLEKLELDLKWMDEPAALLILSEILFEYGFNYLLCKEIFRCIGKPGKNFPGKNFSIYTDRTSLFIKKNADARSLSLLIWEEGSYSIGNVNLDMNMIPTKGLRFDQSNKVAFLSTERLSFPFKVRIWDKGDKFQPLGMKGTKKVSDFLVDKKVPYAKKEEVMVLEKDGEIAWLIGHRISEAFKVLETTQKALRISIDEKD